MSWLLASAMLAAAAAPTTQLPSEGPKFLTAIQACGFKSVTLQYEAELESDVLTVHGEAASDAALNCAVLAVDGSGFLMFFEANYLAVRYHEAEARLYKPRAMASSREWLANRGLLAKVPDFAASGLSDLAFARRIEALCGPSAASALGGNGSAHQFSFEFLEKAQDDSGKRAAFECIMHVSVVSGFGLGFVGNEAVQ